LQKIIIDKKSEIRRNEKYEVRIIGIARLLFSEII